LMKVRPPEVEPFTRPFTRRALLRATSGNPQLRRSACFLGHRRKAECCRRPPSGFESRVPLRNHPALRCERRRGTARDVRAATALRSRPVKLAPIILFACLAACGGKTSGGTAPSSDAAETSRPAPGTPACDAPGPSAGYCIQCSDEMWHCTGRDSGLPVCPADDVPSCCVSNACVESGAGIVCGLPGTCKP
jgi:hypothetical protein